MAIVRPLADTSLINDANLISYWKLDGNANDSKGTKTGVDTGITYPSGLFNQCANFNGSSKIYTSSYDTLLSNEAFSVSIWIKTTSIPSVSTLIISQANSSTINSWYIYLYTNGTIGLNTKGSTDLNIAVSPYPINDGLWHNVIAAFSSSSYASATLYVDGIYIGSNTTGTNITTSKTRGIYIGKSEDTWWPYYTGQLDDISIFNRELSLYDASNLYSQQGKKWNGIAITKFNGI